MGMKIVTKNELLPQFTQTDRQALTDLNRNKSDARVAVNTMDNFKRVGVEQNVRKEASRCI